METTRTTDPYFDTPFGRVYLVDHILDRPPDEKRRKGIVYPAKARQIGRWNRLLDLYTLCGLSTSAASFELDISEMMAARFVRDNGLSRTSSETFGLRVYRRLLALWVKQPELEASKVRRMQLAGDLDVSERQVWRDFTRLRKDLPTLLPDHLRDWHEGDNG